MSWSARLETSWQLLQRSLQVLRSNPRLLLFPVVATGCAIVLAIFFFVPVIALGVALGGMHAGHWAPFVHKVNGAVMYPYWALLYLVSMFVATFFNVAFYHEILRAFAGEPVSLANGLRFARSRIRGILMWSLLAGSVGLIIRAIEERLGWVGRFVMGLVGVAWSVAAVFAIPVIIRGENTNPVAVLRDSAATLKRTWGESLVGFVGIRLAGVALVLTSLVFVALAVLVTFATHARFVLFVVIGGWVLTIAVAAFLISMATHVYRCALYVYASEGVIPEPFTPELMNAAWKVKKA